VKSHFYPPWICIVKELEYLEKNNRQLGRNILLSFYRSGKVREIYVKNIAVLMMSFPEA
jgi:hypothetical protein